MARLLALLVSLSALGCTFDPFELPPLPKTVHIDPAFTEEETALILDKVEMTNRELGSLLGYDILIVGDPLDDPDGFTPDGSDMGDGVHGIYRVGPDSDAYGALSGLADREFGGYATLQDVLMVANLDEVRPLEEEIGGIEAVPGWETVEELAKKHAELVGRLNDVRFRFRKIVAHELGHHIGLSHNPREDTLMYPDARPYEDMQPGDKEAFCFVRGCVLP